MGKYSVTIVSMDNSELPIAALMHIADECRADNNISLSKKKIVFRFSNKKRAAVFSNIYNDTFLREVVSADEEDNGFSEGGE